MKRALLLLKYQQLWYFTQWIALRKPPIFSGKTMVSATAFSARSNKPWPGHSLKWTQLLRVHQERSRIWGVPSSWCYPNTVVKKKRKCHEFGGGIPISGIPHISAVYLFNVPSSCTCRFRWCYDISVSLVLAVSDDATLTILLLYLSQMMLRQRLFSCTCLRWCYMAGVKDKIHPSN